MKKIALLLIILIVGVAALGSVVVVYASSPAVASLIAPTPTPSPIVPTAQPTIADTAATVAPQVKDSVVFQGSSNLPEVALTFDDGPSIYTPQVLSILQANSIHATFFCVGEWVSYYPNYVQQEYSAGNVVGNHTWDHPDLTTLSTTDVQTQINKTSTLIQQTIGVQPTLFRPPYGAINASVKGQIAQMNLTPVLWNIDTQDWTRPGSDAIVNAVVGQAGNGDIILMHDGGGDRSQTVAALPRIIQGLRARGLQMVTVPQLIHDMNTDTTATTTTGTTAVAATNTTQADASIVNATFDRDRPL
jgi:peptidoglycan/xylan/chitin deacetylase (PgdA/CDA1 family)